MSTLKSQNDKLATELTSEQNAKYKQSLELAQQVCGRRRWGMEGGLGVTSGDKRRGLSD